MKSIVIGDNIIVTVSDIKNGQIKLGIDASEIRIRSEIRLGELLLETEKSKGRAEKTGAGSRGSEAVPRKTTPTLSDLGIDKKVSSRAQKMAEIPKNKHEVSRWGINKGVL